MYNHNMTACAYATSMQVLEEFSNIQQAIH